MKKFVLSLFLACTGFYSLHAQSLLSKVPANASLVIKYSGENFSKTLPLQKLDSYDFIRHDLFKMIGVDASMSLQNIGIDLQKDGYQYLINEDSTITFVTMLQLSNLQQFLKFVNDSAKTLARSEKMNGFEFISLGSQAYVAYNQSTALIVNATYNNHKSYYDRHYYSDATDSTYTVTVDTAAGYYGNDFPVLDTTVTVYEAPAQKKPKTIKSGKAPVKKKPSTTAKGKKPAAKKPKVTPKPKEEMLEEITEDVVVSDKYYSVEDSIESMKRDLWYQQQEMIKKARQRDVAVKVVNNFFNGPIVSVETDPAYKKIVDPAANVSAWVNAQNLWNLYAPLFGSGMGMPRKYYDLTNASFSKSDSGKVVDGYKSAANVYFDKDKLRVEQKTFANDPVFANNIKSLMNSKQNSSLTSYVNPGNIGYFSMSVNTEAMIHYYYSMIKNYLSSSYFMREYADIVDIYIDLLEIAIDEKALSDLTPGNFLFVMHDLKPKTVTYTDYTYDEEYNKTEIKGTKKELSPDFTFIVETKNESFMKKLAQLPVKYAAREKFKYAAKEGYYQLSMDSSDVVGDLFFIVKDGKAIVTTSKEVIDITLGAGKGYNIDAATKKSILNNNYSLKINSSALLEKLRGEFSTGVNKKIADYLIDNIGDVKMESALKDDVVHSTTTMDVKGKHTNSFEFFFNMVEAINKIIENDRRGQQNKLD